MVFGLECLHRTVGQHFGGCPATMTSTTMNGLEAQMKNASILSMRNRGRWVLFIYLFTLFDLDVMLPFTFNPLRKCTGDYGGHCIRIHWDVFCVCSYFHLFIFVEREFEFTCKLINVCLKFLVNCSKTKIAGTVWWPKCIAATTRRHI